jgi:hypothetical protein
MAFSRAYPGAAVVHYSKCEHTEYRKLQGKCPDVATTEEIRRFSVRRERWSGTWMS